MLVAATGRLRRRSPSRERALGGEANTWSAASMSGSRLKVSSLPPAPPVPPLPQTQRRPKRLAGELRSGEKRVGETVPGETMETLPRSPQHRWLRREEPVSILQRKSWGRFCRREQPWSHGRGTFQVFSKSCEQCCRFHRSGHETAVRRFVKGVSAGIAPARG